MRYLHVLTLPLILVFPLQTFAVEENKGCVVLLHGLARTSFSMKPLEKALERSGYQVANIGYPSRRSPIEVLAQNAIEEGLEGCGTSHTINFVTHSMGGILVRYYLSKHEIDNLGRIVMLAPPNQGSEIVDNLKNVPGFALWNGPAGKQLGTSRQDLPRQLGPAHFELGVIAGNRSTSPLLSRYLPEPHDGKVSVASTKVAGMSDFLLVPENHTFMMRSENVITQVIKFLQIGEFDQDL